MTDHPDPISELRAMHRNYLDRRDEIQIEQRALAARLREAQAELTRLLPAIRAVGTLLAVADNAAKQRPAQTAQPTKRSAPSKRKRPTMTTTEEAAAP